jgi:Icc-related predicted phosphoesterase
VSTRRITRVVCAADPRGSGEAIERLLEAARDRDAQAIVLVGDLSDGRGGAEGYRAPLRALGASGQPVYWVPGPADAPVADYLREAYNIEVVHPLLHGVHGTAAFGPDQRVLFAGLGGEISDDPDRPRDELERLSYPRWEAEYRLKLLRELEEHELVLAFWTQPAHKSLGVPGSELLAELVNTHRPRLVVCGGERRTAMLGRSPVVAPGSLHDGHYAVADLHTREVELEQLATAHN